MNRKNKVSPKYKTALTALAMLFLFTVQSRDKVCFVPAFHTFLTSFNDTIPSKKKNNVVEE
jgi:hypothetical protein